MTRCKFTCQSVTKSKAWHGAPGEFLFDAKFTAVTSDSPENSEFWAATPSGTLTVGTVKADVFEPGQDYYLDITPCNE